MGKTKKPLTKRRKISTDKVKEENELNKKQKQIPQSRIVRLTLQLRPAYPTPVPREALEAQLGSNYEYLIYPSDDASNNNSCCAGWILHKDVESARNTIQKMDGLVLQRAKIQANFARKLNKMYRVKVNGWENEGDASELQMKTF